MIQANRSITEPEKLERMLNVARECLAVPGEFWELGVFKGGSARELGQICSEDSRILRLFDSFEGMSKPSFYDTGPEAIEGHFRDTSLEEVKEFVNYPLAIYHKGWIPKVFESFVPKGSPLSLVVVPKIAFAYIDLDLFEPTNATLWFLWPHLVRGGVLVIDDYDHPEWPGVKLAVDVYFEPLRVEIQPFLRQAVVRKR